jgi:ELWxxDGT repeat protein
MDGCTFGNAGRTLLALFALSLVLATPMAAQPASRVTDLNTTLDGGTDLWPAAGQFVPLGGLVLFNVADGVHGTELWKTDGTEAGTALVQDICPGACSAGIFFSMQPLGSEIFFSADDGAHGNELWKTDGTGAGTVMVKELRPGLAGSGARPLGAAGGRVVFSADDGTAGRELWVSDGTAAGTILLADLEPGAEGSSPEALATIGSILYFSAHTTTAGRELWRTDGTAAGTSMIADISPGAGDSIFDQPPFPAASYVAVAGGKLFFAAEDGTHGDELWVSDGTAAGTTLVADIQPGSGSSSPWRMATLGTSVVFAADDGTHGRELWVSDGTTAGTTLVLDIIAGSAGGDPAEPVALGTQIFFLATDTTHGRELWKTDGTAAGTALVADVNPGAADSVPFFRLAALTALGTKVLFFAEDGVHGNELWTSDGTAAGTSLLADIVPGPDSSFSGESFGFDFKTVAGGRWYFRVFSSDIFRGREVWTSDGAAAGTHLLKEINTQTSAFDVLWNGVLWGPKPLADAAGTLFFQGGDGAAGFELGKSDGTAAGTGVVADLFPGEGQSAIHELTALGSNVLFSADDGVHGSELWESDGTPIGTSLIADLEAPPNGSPDDYPRSLIRLGDLVLFAGTGGLWKTDATSSGTIQLRADLEMSQPVVHGTHVFFAGGEAGTGIELWKADGSDSGTVLIKDIAPGAASSSAPDGLVSAGGLVFFSADDGTVGRELWKSDGTEDGTVLVKDVCAGSSIHRATSDPEHGDVSMVSASAAGATVFFLADDGVAGEELWKSDGTAAGTVLVKDIFPGPRSSEILWLTGAGSRAYFVADDGVHGRELWTSDGTEAGTAMVADIVPGAGSSLPTELSVQDGVLLFSAFDAAHGREPWRSDGTAGGTRLLQDIAPGPLPSSPLRFTRSGSSVYFVATDATAGFELWALPLTALDGMAFYTVMPCRVFDTRTTTPLSSDVTRTFAVAGACGIPAEAKAVAANLTVVGATAGGHLVAWPAGTAMPATSTMNFSTGQVRANNAILPLAASGLDVRPTLSGGGTVHLILDVVGYFQ